MAVVFLSGPSVAQTKDGEFVGNWKYECAGTRCQGYIGIGEPGNPQVVLSIQPNDAGDGLVAVARVPLETVLPPGVRLFTGDVEFLSMPFQICRAAGCDAAAAIDAETRSRLESILVARLAFFRRTDPGEPAKGYTYEIPVTGFAQLAERLLASP